MLELNTVLALAVLCMVRAYLKDRKKLLAKQKRKH